MQKTIKLMVAGVVCSGLMFFCVGCDKESTPPKQQAVKQQIPMEKKAAPKVPAAQPSEKTPAVKQPPVVSGTATTAETEPAPVGAVKPEVPTSSGTKAKGDAPDETIASPEMTAASTADTVKALPDNKETGDKKGDDGDSTEAVVTPEEPTPGAIADDVPEAQPVVDEKTKESDIEFDIGLEKDSAVSSGKEDLATYNPFEPLFKKKKAKMQALGASDDPRNNRAFLTPLEQIGLGQVTLTGVVQVQSGNRAMVKDASGKGYVLRQGTYIGLHSGRVKKITGDRVIIEEIIDGRPSVTELKLQKPAGE